MTTTRKRRTAMTDKSIRIPGPDHPITITPHPSRIVVTAGGKVIADTRNALSLQEANYPAVIYIPRQDADMSLLERSETASYCPYKGDCTYFSIPAGGARSINAVWSYEAPYDSMAAVTGYLAVYPGRVDAIDIL